MDDKASGGRMHRRSFVLAAGALLILGTIGGFAYWRTRSSAVPFEAKFSVGVRPDMTRPIVLLEEAGALPVHDGGALAMEVRYTQPSHTYLVWIGSQGQVVPLYPWNIHTLEVEDLNEAPPSCMASRHLLSPMDFGATWPLKNGAGLETVLLLARRTPLDSNVRLGDLVGKPSAAKLRHAEELSVLALDRTAPAAKTMVAANRGSAEEMRAVDAPLLELLERLRPHFELIRVVRFAHAGM
jgi:hypothetical protein